MKNKGKAQVVFPLPGLIILCVVFFVIIFGIGWMWRSRRPCKKCWLWNQEKRAQMHETIKKGLLDGTFFAAKDYLTGEEVLIDVNSIIDISQDSRLTRQRQNP